MRFYKAVAHSESGLDPIDIYWEKSLGEPKGYDKKTGKKYLSEGLYQLSGSDARYYGCNFDEMGDAKKEDQDPTKTIFNPENNIRCAVKIMSRQLFKYGDVFDNRSYWAVLRKNRSSHKNFRWYYDIKYKNECK